MINNKTIAAISITGAIVIQCIAAVNGVSAGFATGALLAIGTLILITNS